MFIIRSLRHSINMDVCCVLDDFGEYETPSGEPEEGVTEDYETPSGELETD